MVNEKSVPTLHDGRYVTELPTKEILQIARKYSPY